ncbi:ABC transporter ATP-binding protein [Herbaspirillum seropedicae]|uniref:ABC transporter ATP-binding protein n=1 Tax=Herbaspirillum seropedicae TaxID=964 RepID=UPI003D9594B4
MSASAASLAFDNLVAGYADTPVLHGVSGTLPAGHVLGVIGRNGVGKSTLIRTLAGVIHPFSGSVSLSAQLIGNRPAYAYRALGISYAPQERVVFDDLTVADKLTLGRASRDMRPFALSFGLFPRIAERLGQKAGIMSGGEKKLLSFVRILAEDSPFTLLDEPTEGVAPDNLALMVQALLEREERGRSFLVAEQNIEFLLAVADSLVIMDHGVFVAAGTGGSFRGSVSRDFWLSERSL